MSIKNVDKYLLKRFVTVLILLFALALSACSKGDSDEQTAAVTEIPTPSPSATPAPTATPTPTPTPIPTPTPNLHIGESRSLLDGSWIKDEVYNKRPYAVMLNNIEFANPQSGVGEAKILYECLVEAGITRLMGLFEGLDENSSCAERIGSVRSSRHYYCNFADAYDAIYVHYGETTYATKKIEKLKLDHLEGTYGIGDTVFYRDKSIKAPHNAFASLAGIEKGVEKLGIRTELTKDYEQHFEFNEEAAEPSAGEVHDAPETVTLPYSSYMSPYFTYDKETQLYTRYQFKDLHIDYNTKEPLTFTNIIVQIVAERDKDKNGYQTMDIDDDKGHGYYISMGKICPITWEMKAKTRFMRFYDADGNILKINPGKTFISVFPDFRESKLEIY